MAMSGKVYVYNYDGTELLATYTQREPEEDVYYRTDGIHGGEGTIYSLSSGHRISLSRQGALLPLPSDYPGDWLFSLDNDTHYIYVKEPPKLATPTITKQNNKLIISNIDENADILKIYKDGILYDTLNVLDPILEVTFRDGITLNYNQLKLPENAEKYGYDATKITRTSIGDYIFNNSLTGTIKVGGSITSIGAMPFGWVTNPSYNILPNVKTIGAYALKSSGDGVYNSINLPYTITNIGGGAIGQSTQRITISNFNYSGTRAQWNAIQKDSAWLIGSGTVTLHCTDGNITVSASCFLPDTLITLADGSKKKIQDIIYSDKLKVWNFDEGKYDTADICWLTCNGLTNDHYYKLTFSDGMILNVTGTNSNHKMYCIETHKFEGCAYLEIGKHVFTENGVVELINREYIEEETPYYNLITTTHYNCFANGVLTSDRYNNMYDIDEDMKYIKEGREIKPYSEFAAYNIKKYWYDSLRLGEVRDDIDQVINYINKLELQMRPKDEEVK